MKQWLSTPVTYGRVIRIQLFAICIFLILVAGIDLAFNIGGPHWTAVSAAILTVIGLIIGLVGLRAHFPTLPVFTWGQALELLKQQEEQYLKKIASRETGTLIVSTGKENQHTTVYLLPRGDFLKCHSAAERDNNPHKKRATFTGEIYGSHLLFVARFRNLKPGRYDMWVGWNIDKPKNFTVQITEAIMSISLMD